MIEILKAWDTQLLLWINGMHCSFFDGVMFAISYRLTWVLFYAAVLYAVVMRWKREAGWIVLALVLCIVFADQISSGVIKDLVQRLRPSHEPSLLPLIHLVRGYDGGNFGFVSSHAANSFGFALLSSILFRRKLYTIAAFTWAAFTAYSRMYLGVHYPLDILGGIVVGITGALIAFYTIKKLRPSLLVEVHAHDYSRGPFRVEIPVAALAITFVGIIIYSLFIF